MNRDLVSLLVPCFRGEGTIARLIDSVVAQTYPHIELVIVNDGSDDCSEEIIQSYEEVLRQGGRTLVYVYQENKGLGSAIDTALKHFHGAYICFADADDFLAPTSIQRRVEFLRENPSYAVVSSDAYAVSEQDLTKPLSRISDGVSSNEDEEQFWHLLNANSIFCTGCHMIRAEDFLKVNPDRSIYPARRGQNWQLLLPVYYQYKRAFLNEPLYYYVISEGSMSDDNNDPKKQLIRCDEHEIILNETLSRMKISEADLARASKLITVNYSRKRLYIAGRNGIKDLAKLQYDKLKALGENNRKDLFQLWIAKSGFLRKLYLK